VTGERVVVVEPSATPASTHPTTASTTTNKRSGRSRPRLILEPLIGASIAYTSGLTASDWGGKTIAEVMRQVWNRLAHKQWLIFYPLALAIINVLAFVAVYSAAGGELAWSRFFATDFDRWKFVRDHFLSGFSFTPALAVAVFAGLVVCVITAMIKAPLFRAIAGPGYPRTPRSWDEVGRLALFYVFFNFVLVVLPLTAPSATALSQLVAWMALVVNLFLVYADYVIVFEGLAVLPALRRSARLLSRRWAPALLIFAILWLVAIGLNTLYGRYYNGAEGVSLLVPLSEILVWSFINLLLDLVFISLYEHVRNTPR
jgi:hypothetical protein